MSDINQPFMVIRKRLAPEEVAPTTIRYDAGCDCVQVTYDGGATWIDNPDADPRHNPAGLFPARTGSDPRCDAAENMMQHFKAQVNAFLDSASVLQFVNAFLTLLLLIIPGVGAIIELLFIVGESLLTIGSTVIDAAMTDPVYDEIKCILYCNIDDNGQMSAEALARTYADVNAQIAGTAALVFQVVTQAWGEVGFSNAGANGDFVGDCDCPDCNWCYELDFTTDNYGGYAVSGFVGCGWAFGTGYYNSGVYGYTEIPLNVDWFAMEIQVDIALSGSIDGTANCCIFAVDSGGTIDLIEGAGGGCLMITPTTDYLPTGSPYAGYRLRLNPTNQHHGGVITIQRIRFYGSGTNPFPESNC